jgi:hypothetical protein
MEPKAAAAAETMTKSFFRVNTVETLPITAGTPSWT